MAGPRFPTECLARIDAPAAVRTTAPHAPIATQGRANMRKAALSLTIVGLALPFIAASPAHAQASRTWVSGGGDDTSPTCSRTAPCRTFAGALAGNKTAPGGEINCLDAADFGPATITFSLTISCDAGTAGVQVSAAPDIAIYIDAATTDVVTLRGLDLDGRGGAATGIGINSAKAVHVENCIIRNFRSVAGGAGIRILAGVSFTVFLFVADTVISSNGTGVRLVSAGGFKVASLKNVTITGSMSDGVNLVASNVFVNATKSVISGNGGNAINAGVPGGTANIDRSTIANNAVALNANGSTIRISGTTSITIQPASSLRVARRSKPTARTTPAAAMAGRQFPTEA
jgi:hypothetical protein